MLGKLFNLTAGTAADADADDGPNLSSAALPSQPISSLESVQEDMHTRNLLYPDAESLFQHRNDQVFPLSAGPAVPSASTAGSFDYDNDVFLDSQDIRILIMQDAMSSIPAALIYDSHSPPAVANSPSDRPVTVAGSVSSAAPTQDVRRGGPVSPRKATARQSSRPSSVQYDHPSQQQQQQQQRFTSAFDRRASMHGRTQPRVESDSQRVNREYSDEINVFSSCIFGNSELMAYKGTSTKVHVVPTDHRNETTAAAFADGRGSLGRSSVRSSKLSQSFSSDAMGGFMPQVSAGSSQRAQQRKKVLITRLFPVALPNDDALEPPLVTPNSRHSEDSAGGFPFPQASEEAARARKRRTQQLRQKRTPMYAVALIINLPQAPGGGCANSVPASAISASKHGGFRGSDSFFDGHDSFPSSFGSARRSGWTLIGQGAGLDQLDSCHAGDIEERLDPITHHWDIIMRTLTHLQSVVATKLHSMLRHVDISSPDPTPSSSLNPQPSRQPSLSRRRSDDAASMYPPKLTTKTLTLLPFCLMEDQDVSREIGKAQDRIVAGLRATRVVTGQNRWGIWREEARWVARWASAKGQGLFFHSLLTGYLATHTDWLQALGPSYYRKLHQDQARARCEEDTSLPARTVIVARDKMAARRLVFLLAAFLPANQQLPISLRTHRPSTSTSFGGPFSHSPPSYAVPILKEESLRRKINRRAAPRRTSHSHQTTATVQQQNPNPPSRGSGVPVQLAHLTMERGHERRSSDALSVRTSHLSISAAETPNRKSSAATAATVTPEPTVPHFATLQRQESLPGHRPTSARSTAADDLKRTLARGDSGLSGQNAGSLSPSGNGESRPPSSTWGVLAGLWNARRRGSRGSTDMSSHKRDSMNSLSSVPPLSPTKGSLRIHQERLRSPVQLTTETRAAFPGVGGGGGDDKDAPDQELLRSGENGLRSPRHPKPARRSDDGPDMMPPPPTRRSGTFFQRTPDPSGVFESPVKTSLNIHDGVIDVDVAFPDYITSFETAISSPSSSGYLSTPGGSGLEMFEQSSRNLVDGDLPFNVAGWLQSYHPDFVLQAIPPQRDLLDQIRESLKAEPSPVMPFVSHSTSSESQQERWIDVSSVMIADTTTFSITRIRYRRLVKAKQLPDLTAGAMLSASSATTHTPPVALLTPAVAPYETKLEEEFIVEPIVTLDDILVEAVERVVGAVGSESASSSRSASKRRERRNSEEAAGTGGEVSGSRTVAVPPGRNVQPVPEVPRAECKTVILSALEDVIREVLERRDRELRDSDHDQHQQKETELTLAVRGWLESVELSD